MVWVPIIALIILAIGLLVVVREAATHPPHGPTRRPS